jgi:hypothetical protein
MKQAVRAAIGLAVAVPAVFAFAGIGGPAFASEPEYGTTVEVDKDEYTLTITAREYKKNDIKVVQKWDKKHYRWFFEVSDRGDKVVNKDDKCYRVDDYTLNCPLYKPTIWAKDKDDKVTYDNSKAGKYDKKIPVWIYGGYGDDRLKGGTGDDYLIDTDGYDKDALFGRGGSDYLNAFDHDFKDYVDGGEDKKYDDYDKCVIDRDYKKYKSDSTAGCEKVFIGGKL